MGDGRRVTEGAWQRGLAHAAQILMTFKLNYNFQSLQQSIDYVSRGCEGLVDWVLEVGGRVSGVWGETITIQQRWWRWWWQGRWRTGEQVNRCRAGERLWQSAWLCKGQLYKGWAYPKPTPRTQRDPSICLFCLALVFRIFANFACLKDTQQPERTLKVKG